MKQLNTDELEKLQQWQKQMVTIFVITMLSLLIVIGADIAIGLSQDLAWYFFIILVILAALGVFIQFNKKCPRCNYRLGFQTRLLLPDSCKKCSVKLK